MSLNRVRPVVTCLSLFLLLACSAVVLASDEGELAPAAVAAVERLFPGSAILDVEQETEAGVAFYEVAVRAGSRRLEVEVTADGLIGEIETAIEPSALPRAVAEGFARIAAGASVKHAERHEVRGVPQNGTFAPVDPPRVLYELSYVQGGERREIALGEDGKPVQQTDDDTDGDDDDLEEEEEGAASRDLG
jgi:hypothetical protein